MKSYILKYITIICAVTMLSACDNWLDVSPKTEIKADENFGDEQGFKDALSGVYLLMNQTSLYGRELSFGMLDALAQYYTGITATNHTYYQDTKYNYEYESVKSRIDNIWNNSYKALANLNELIKYTDEANQTMFTGRNYHLIRGESYALRAFLHFDILRLFAPAYVVNPDVKSIPYVDECTTQSTPYSTVKEVLARALADLKIAEEELAYDPVIDGYTESATDYVSYQRDRTFKINYYAVKMLQARIYLYMGEYDNAYSAAVAVINQSAFTFTPENEISTTVASSKNYVWSEELVFSLYNSDLRTQYTTYFSGEVGGLYMPDASYEALYETEVYGAFSDYRYIYQTEMLSTTRFSNKLKQPTNGNSNYLNRTPMMRLSEAYYIAAECLINQNHINDGLKLLQAVRGNRGITAEYSTSLNTREAMNEVYKEYAKEYLCEGQLWFFFKRLNYDQIPVYSSSNGGAIITYVTPAYIFPLPDDEIEFGNNK